MSSMVDHRLVNLPVDVDSAVTVTQLQSGCKAAADWTVADRGMYQRIHSQ
jgi:hypothetical protein